MEAARAWQRGDAFVRHCQNAHIMYCPATCVVPRTLCQARMIMDHSRGTYSKTVKLSRIEGIMRWLTPSDEFGGARPYCELRLDWSGCCPGWSWPWHPGGWVHKIVQRSAITTNRWRDRRADLRASGAGVTGNAE